MRLNELERKELATFFNKRSELVDIEKVRLRTGVAIPSAVVGTGVLEWIAFLEQADAQNRLPLVASTIRSFCPEDANLQSICGILDDRKSHSWNQIASVMNGAGIGFVSAGLVGLVVGVISLSLSASPDVSVAKGPDAENSIVIEQGLQSSLQPQSRKQPESIMVSETVSPIEPAVASAPAPTLQPQSLQPQSLQPQSVKPSKSGRLASRCHTPNGQKIGYFHWGPVTAGQPSGETVITRSVNVRADYPKAANSYDTRSKVRCVLRRGERIQLKEEAILVAGGHYWVPLYSDALIKG